MDLRFSISNIIYQNSDNGYSVLNVKLHEAEQYAIVVGTFADIRREMDILASGEWGEHRKYGRQFVVSSWQEVLPNTIIGIEKYLASGQIRGIGPKLASLIVCKFGLDTLTVMDNDINRLSEIHGIGYKKMETIRESWEKQQTVKNIMIFLQSFNVSTAYAVRIYKKYGVDSIRKVKENPYRLADDIAGIGFKMADTIALNMGYSKDDHRRISSGIVYTLSRMASDGHVFAFEDRLKEDACTLLEIEDDNYDTGLRFAMEDDKIVIEDDRVYLTFLYDAEKMVAEKLKELNNPVGHFSEFGTKLEDITSMNYNNNQKQAIYTAMEKQVMVLTGGPGTGKTTTVLGIINLAEYYGMKVLLAAPTGRAAKRMKESTNREAKTIHRLLEYSAGGGYQRNEENPLKGNLLIADECSMIDIVLMNNLLKAVPPDMQVVFVGDADQLPAVGAGNVLNDMIQSKVIPVVKLTEIFRQAKNSRIITNAHRINSGLFPDLSNGHNSDFFFIKKEKEEEASEEIVSLVTRRLPKAYSINPLDIQVLTPMKKGILGTIELNARLQEGLNPVGTDLQYMGYTYRVNDKVMQIKNNYEKNVFNGDIGFIKNIDKEEGTCNVVFDGTAVEYDNDDLDELVPAYACTIHKSQGSEFPVVVMTSSMAHYIMLQRNLLYTGITRAKKICVIVGDDRSIHYSIHNTKIRERNSFLISRLRQRM